MQRLLDFMLKVWLECGLSRSSFQPNVGNSIWMPTRPESLKNIPFYWTRLSHALCMERLVGGVFEVPMISAPNLAVIWVGEHRFEFSEFRVDCTTLTKPHAPHPVVLAVGGASGSGKTTLVRRLQKRLPGQVLTYPAYTTRPKRPEETDGLDYHFRSADALGEARLNPMFTDFVEARGYWYWINPGAIVDSAWRNSDKVHAFFISQRHDFERRRQMFPQIRWVWLEASEEDIRNRLNLRGDQNIESSIEYNRKLAAQSVGDLVDLRITTQFNDFDGVAETVLKRYISKRG